MKARRALTIGIDARAAAEEPAGGGRYVRELVRGLAALPSPHRFLLYARRPVDLGLDRRFSWRLLPRPDPWWNLDVARRAGDDCDAFLSTNSYLTAWVTRVPTAVVVYDLVAFDPALRPSRRAGLIERATLPLALRRADAVLAISRATAEALEGRFPATRGRVAVTPLAAAPALAGPDDATEPSREPFVLAVGTLEPRKNLPRLVAAYRALPEALRAAHPLVVVGRLGWEAGETVAALRELGDRARVLGVVDDAELAGLYRRCAVLAYPSLGEGFGLPVLEAMHVGAAVLTSDRSSLPEVGGDAVEYADPTSVASIAATLERLLLDPGRRAELGARARRRAASFSWETTARLTLDELERIAG